MVRIGDLVLKHRQELYARNDTTIDHDNVSIDNRLHDLGLQDNVINWSSHSPLLFDPTIRYPYGKKITFWRRLVDVILCRR